MRYEDRYRRYNKLELFYNFKNRNDWLLWEKYLESVVNDLIHCAYLVNGREVQRVMKDLAEKGVIEHIGCKRNKRFA